MSNYKVGQVIKFQREIWMIRNLIILGKEPWLVLFRSDGESLESMLIPEAWADEDQRLFDLALANEF